ncbi:MAG: flagellar hook protein FlgE [SAR324 cluster bacterium]|nr:flagellar hook protein FlgE [SAR324 cluster bacterium]
MVGLRTGATGLSSYGEAMTVVGSNIANVNTVGYKGNRVNFQDLLATSVRGSRDKVGKGVRISSVQADFAPGSMESSSRTLDMALEGDGFFTLRDKSNRLFYTRAGNFELDDKGFLVTVNGINVLMRDIDENTGEVTGLAKPVQLVGVNDPPKATGDGTNGTGIRIAANLNSDASVPEVQFDPTNVQAEMYNNSTAVTVTDERGGEHVVNVVFRKLADTPAQVDPVTGAPIPGTGSKNQWQWYFVVNASEVGGEPNRLIAVSGGFLKFDENGRLLETTNGEFTTPGAAQIGPAGQIIPPGPPVLVERAVDGNVGVPQVTLFFTENPQTIGIDLGTGSNPTDPTDERTGLEGVTAFASEFNILKLEADGSKPGQLENFEIDDDGVVTGFFNNGNMRQLHRLFVTRFVNNPGLLRAGDNRFSETRQSGKAITGNPNEGQFGAVKSRNLEKSNVDLSTEFVRMIETQRAFQANAKVITTGDEMLADLVNMKR